MRVPTRRPARSRSSRYVLWAVFAACIAVGIVVGAGGFATSSDSGERASGAVAATTRPAPTITPIVTAPRVASRPVGAPRRGPLTNIHVETQPPGALAMLVDGDMTWLVGVSPVDIEVERGRQYDVVLALDNHQTQMVHVDPATSSDVRVELGATRAR
jgi:hypothetical protein